MTNTNNIPTNGNCKAVRDITNNIKYGSVTEAARANGVTIPTMSQAINNKHLCNGKSFRFEKDLHENTDELCAENAKANARAVRAEARVAEMESEMAEFRKWQAEQERIRKQQEAERKAKEELEKAIAKMNEKVTMYQAEVERRKAKLNVAEQKLMCAEIELEALLDRKEVA